jgi:ribosome biogenesis GTPase / thiamine phosphate phosphatase
MKPLKNNPYPASLSTRIGIVTQNNRESYTLLSDGEYFTCRLTSNLNKSRDRFKKGKSERFADSVPGPTVGDEVSFLPHPEDRILEVYPRRNHLSRRAAVPMPGAAAGEQVIAANLDLAVPVFAVANPEPKWNLLDRYLAASEAAGIPALVCLTKADLAEENVLAIAAEYRAIGYPVVLTSSMTGRGLSELAQALAGRTSILLGKSGVGKTSLLNALEPGLGRRVAEISSATGKGRHTTTSAELFPLAAGGSLIDSPGVREFGLWGIAREELADLFPEMRPYAGKCKFGLDCSHDEEPGCALRQAVVAGRVSPRRYASYIHLREDL